MPRRAPDLLAYPDYRRFLRDHYAWRKSRDRGFSYGSFARRAGLGSRGHLKEVMDGKKGLTAAMLERYCRGLALTPDRAEYFRLLVAFKQDGGEASRSALRKWWTDREQRSLEGRQGREFFGRLDNLLVRVLSRHRGFRPDPRWISRRLRGRVSPAQARAVLGYLRAEGFLPSRPKRGPLPHWLSFEAKEDLEAFRRQSLEAGLSRDPGFGDTSVICALLNRKQAEKLGRDLYEWMKVHVPPKNRTDPRAEVCLVVGDVFAVSRF